MSRNIILTFTSLSLALVLSASALAQQGGGGSAGGGGDEVRPARVGGGGGMGGGGRGGGVAGGGGGAIGGGGEGAFGGGVGPFGPPPSVQVGIAMDRVPEALAAHLGVDPNEVVLIVHVVDGEAAHKAGLERFDVITHLDGESPVTQETIRRMARAKEPGDSVALRVLRGGEVKEVSITLAEPVPQRYVPWGGGGNFYLSPEQMQELRLQFNLSPEQTREWRQQFRREWREQRPEIEAHLRRFREESEQLRETLATEWREHWREFKLDDESREKLGKWLESAAERTAEALERVAEALEGVEIEIDVQPPRVEILRDGGGLRAMVVQPDDAARRQVEAAAERARAQEMRSVERSRAIEREALEGGEVRRPALEMDRRLNRLEERLERMERMMRQLLERDGEE